MSIQIENNSYIFEDEELDDIEYLEILSMEEIIKNNPNFIALSVKEIKTEFFNFFHDEKKAQYYTTLLFDILDNNKEKVGQLKDFSKYIFVSSATKKNNTELDIAEDAKYFNSLAKLNTSRYIEAKNRYFFSIVYDDTSKSLRYKPVHNINVEIFEKFKAEFPKYYPIFSSDDVNIPIIGSYFRVPFTTNDDYLYKKTISHLFQTKNINYKEASLYSSIEKLINDTKPDINILIESLKNLDDDFELDYECLNNHFKKYGNSLDFINLEDFEVLEEYMRNLTSQNKERTNVYRSFKSKRPDISNKKLSFFERFENTLKLLNISDSSREKIDKLHKSLLEHKINDFNDVPLLYDNIYDIVHNINSGNVSIEQVIENIKSVKKRINIDYSIETLDNILKTNEKIEEILTRYEDFKNNFEYNNQHLFNIDKSQVLFVSFHNEIKEIIMGGNEDNYEGVPDILKNNDYEKFEDLENDLVDIISSKNDDIDTNLDKYWLNIKYREEYGFIEILKILLPYFSKIQSISGIHIDMFLLCEELFANFRGIPTKYSIFKKYLEETSLTIPNDIITDIMKIPPYSAINTDLKMDANIQKIIINTNNDYIKVLNEVFSLSIGWYCLNIQEKIINDNSFINDNNLNPVYIEKWFAYGSPINLKEKTGVLQYICAIVSDFLEENTDYALNKSLQKETLKIIEEHYKNKIEQLRSLNDKNKKERKIEKGILAQKIMIENIQNKKFNRIATDYIDALLYMPGVNYKKIHKFILGCCLQKIDKNFKADNDLYTNSRKDLIDIKKKFATRKETNKKRYLRYYPITIEKESNVDNNFFINVEKISMPLDTENDKVVLWLNNMYNKNPLLPSNIIDSFKENSRNVMSIIENYIKILQTTSRNKNSNFQSYFMTDKLNYRAILLNIMKILNNYTKDDENVQKLIVLSSDSIRNILLDLDKLNEILSIENIQDINRINLYICARALCLPCNPELSVNNIMKCIMITPSNYIEENSKNIHHTILNYLKSSIFPSVDEITNFLNSKREENKQIKLSILNNKTVEENQLITNLKKAGIINNLMDLDRDLNDMNDIYERDMNDIKYDIDFEEDNDDNDLS